MAGFNLEHMVPNAVTAWQKRAELEAINLGMSAECGRVCFWGIVLDIVLGWPKFRFIDWAHQVERVYGKQSLAVYDRLQRLYNTDLTKDALGEVCLRVTISIPGQVMAKYRGHEESAA